MYDIINTENKERRGLKNKNLKNVLTKDKRYDIIKMFQRDKTKFKKGLVFIYGKQAYKKRYVYGTLTGYQWSGS